MQYLIIFFLGIFSPLTEHPFSLFFCGHFLPLFLNFLPDTTPSLPLFSHWHRCCLHLVSQVKIVTKSWESKWQNFGIKLSPKIIYIERSLWLKFGINLTYILFYFILFVFLSFSHFGVILVGSSCPVWVDKNMIVILTFLSFIQCILG